jgi:predicted house-cleaning noncanonical NTP pyrophosphatase (MazG superfamily)
LPKLVRDKIPQRLVKKGISHTVRIESLDNLYASHLRAKLREEVDEYLEHECIEELADILEVLDALIEFRGFDRIKLEKFKARKQREAGGFTGRVVLLDMEASAPPEEEAGSDPAQSGSPRTATSR